MTSYSVNARVNASRDKLDEVNLRYYEQKEECDFTGALFYQINESALYRCHTLILTNSRVRSLFMRDLGRLQVLDARDTQLRAINTAGLGRLRYLILTNTPMERLNTDPLTSLIYLDVERTRISELETRGLAYLQYLNISFTGIATIRLSTIPLLDTLYAEGIDFLVDYYAPALRKVMLSKLPSDNAWLHGIKHMTLTSDVSCGICGYEQHFTQLESLDVSQTAVLNVDLRKFQKLTSISVTHIQFCPESAKRVVSLHIGAEYAKILNYSLFSNLKKLIVDNKTQFVFPSAFSPKPEYMQLTGANVAHLSARVLRETQVLKLCDCINCAIDFNGLNALVELDLSGSDQYRLDTTTLCNLATLRVTRSYLAALDFTTLPKLQKAEISGQMFRQLSVVGLYKLAYLHIMSVDLEHFTAKKLPALESLTFAESYVALLCLQNIKALRNLDLHGTFIQKSSVARLPALQYLRAYNTRFPDFLSFINLTMSHVLSFTRGARNLYALEADANVLKWINRKLYGLKHMALYGKEIQKLLIPEGLCTLELHNTNVTAFDAKHFDSIRTLVLKNCSIFGVNFTKFKRIERLEIDSTKLFDKPMQQLSYAVIIALDVSNLESLVTLKIVNSRLHGIMLGANALLEDLVLQDIEQKILELQQLRRLRNLDLTGSYMEVIFGNYPFLLSFNAYKLPLYKLDTEIAPKLQTLRCGSGLIGLSCAYENCIRQLCISQAQIESIDLAKFPYLSAFDAQGSALRKIELKLMAHLLYVDISNTRIKTLDSRRLPALEKLYAEGSDLCYFGTHYTPNIKKIRLGNTRVKWVSVSNLTKLWIVTFQVEGYLFIDLRDCAAHAYKVKPKPR